MIDLDQLELYLPKYLSPSDTKNLIDELKQFPEAENYNYYSSIGVDEKTIYQGDCLNKMPVVRFGN